jgi:hypothetical protein
VGLILAHTAAPAKSCWLPRLEPEHGRGRVAEPLAHLRIPSLKSPKILPRFPPWILWLSGKGSLLAQLQPTLHSFGDQVFVNFFSCSQNRNPPIKLFMGRVLDTHQCEGLNGINDFASSWHLNGSLPMNLESQIDVVRSRGEINGIELRRYRPLALDSRTPFNYDN